MTENNYSELEKELARLKSELDVQDEMTSRFQSSYSVTPNYWQKRLAEEQELWEKRLQAREEEKKILEARIKKQDLNLEEYRQKLQEMEKNFERELKNYEERFRVKEADLLLEKNRLLWEEKIKDAESETRQLLEKINTLNETIAHLKDENLADREKLQAQHAEEKRLLDEKIASLESIIKKLEDHLSEVKTASNEETEKLKNELSARREEVEALSAARSALDAQKNSLLKEIDALNSRLEEEKKIYESTLKDFFRRAIEILDEKTASLERLMDYRRHFRIAPSVEDIRIFLLEIKSEVVGFQKGVLPRQDGNNVEGSQQISVAVIGDSDRANSVASVISRLPAVRCRINEIPKVMPSAIVCDTLKTSLKLSRKYPFMPVVCFADSTEAVKSEKIPPNLKIFSSENPSSVVLVVKEAEEAALQSFVRPSIWHSLIPPNPFLNSKFFRAGALLLVGFLTGGIIISLIFARGGEVNLRGLLSGGNVVKEFSVPYPMPTSVAIDGDKYLWSCDWQGGAIYQHSLDTTLSLNKIAYFPNQTFSALAYHKGVLYSANPWTKKISKHLINGNFTIEKEYSTGGLSVGALAFISYAKTEIGKSGSDNIPSQEKSSLLYLADAQSPRLVAGYLDDEKNVFVPVDEYPLADKGATAVVGPISGLWYDGGYLWACDSLSNYVYRYKISDGKILPNPEVYLLPESYRKNFKVSGFVGKKRKSPSSTPDFWISSERLGKIISIPYSRLIRLENEAK